MDICQLIEQDHRAVLALSRRLHESDDPATAKDIYRQNQLREIARVAGGSSEEEEHGLKYLKFVILPLVGLIGAYCVLRRMTRN